MNITCIILLVFWIVLYKSVRRNIVSGYVYFFLLVFMALPPMINTPDSNVHNIQYWYDNPNIDNVIIFAICLCVGYIPWNVFDKRIKNICFEIPQSAIRPIKWINLFLILISTYSILYLSPYAMQGLILGADNVRQNLYSGEGGLVPNSIFTTIAAAGAGLYIYCVLFFFISSLSDELKKFRIWLVISSLSYIVNCFAFTLRDGLIFTPLYYIAIFLVFRGSMNFDLRKKVKKQIKKIILIAASFLLIFSISRFGKSEDKEQAIAGIYGGTVGYISQQPYVFDATVTEQDDFWGFECRYPLINRLLGISEYKVNRSDHWFEWSFGTMYSEHYSAFGWHGVFWITLIYVLFYSLGIKYLFSRQRYFAALLLFSVFIYIAISGMFYTRVGTNVNLNIFYFSLSLIPFIVPNYLNIVEDK